MTELRNDVCRRGLKLSLVFFCEDESFSHEKETMFMNFINISDLEELPYDGKSGTGRT